VGLFWKLTFGGTAEHTQETMRVDDGSRPLGLSGPPGGPAVLVALLLASRVTIAQESAAPLELIGDRPDFTESAVTVAPLHLQGELGVAYSTLGDERVLTAPDLLLRYGLVNPLEVRLGVPSAEASFTGSETTVEPGGLEMGLKATRAVGQSGAVGLLPYAVLPVKKRHWSDTGLELGLKGVWSVDFNDTVGLGGNVGVAFQGVAPGSAEYDPEYLASLSLGLSFLEWLGAFAEVYGLMNDDADVRLVADGGLTFLVAPRLQLDVHAGVGLTSIARGFDSGAGAILLL
jgi:hypothetical protein